MALVLIKDITGKGNIDSATGRRMPLQKRVGPGGRDVWARGGGDALELDLGKAAGLIFRPWEAVFCPSGRAQEDAILRHVRATWGEDDPPIRRLVYGGRENPDVWAEYVRRHPEVLPKSPPGTPEHLREVLEASDRFDAKGGGGGVRKAQNAMLIKDIESVSQAQVDAMIPSTTAQKGRAVGGDFQRSVTEGASDQASHDARVSKYADAVFEQKYAEHRESGKSEAQAKTYAERSRQKALRAGPEADA